MQNRFVLPHDRRFFLSMSLELQQLYRSGEILFRPNSISDRCKTFRISPRFLGLHGCIGILDGTTIHILLDLRLPTKTHLVVTSVEQVSFNISVSITDPAGKTLPWQSWQHWGSRVLFQKKMFSSMCLEETDGSVELQTILKQPQQDIKN